MHEREQVLQVNTQSREQQNADQVGLEVFKVWETIQGEGPHVGTPSIFIRLAGCNLQCPSCDTDYTSTRIKMSEDELLSLALSMREGGLVVITGGEPLRQPIGNLCSLLIVNGYTVQIETNGALFVSEMPWQDDKLKVVCSPKTPKIHTKVEPHIDAYKYVVQDGYVDEHDGLPNRVLGMNVRAARPPKTFPKSAIYVQPADEQDEAINKRNVAAAVASCLKFGHRLCLQTQKIISVE